MPGNSDQKAPMPGNAFAQKAWANRSLVKAEEKSETGEKGDKIEKAKGEASKNADMHSHKHEAAKPNPLFSGLNKPLPTHPGEGKKSTVAMIDEALTPLIKAQQAADADRIVAKNPEAFVNPQEFNVSWTDTPPPLRPRSKKRPVYDFSKTNAKVAESSAGPSTPIGQLSGPGSGDNGKKAGPSKGPSPSLAAFSGWSVSSLSKHSDGNESSARNDGMILGQGGMSPSTTGSYGRQGKGKLAISPRVESMAGIISEAAEEHLTLRAISKASSNIDGMLHTDQGPGHGQLQVHKAASFDSVSVYSNDGEKPNREKPINKQAPAAFKPPKPTYFSNQHKYAAEAYPLPPRRNTNPLQRDINHQRSINPPQRTISPLNTIKPSLSSTYHPQLSSKMAIPNTPTSQESTAEGHRLASHFSELQNQLDADVNDIKDKLDEHQNTLLSNIQQHFEDNKTLQTQFSSQVASRLGSIDGNVSLVQQQSRTMGVLMERFNSRQEEILEEIGATEARSKIRQEQIMEKILEKILEVKIAVEARSNEQERLLRECLAVTRTARTVGAEVHPALRPSQGERLGGEGATTRPPFPPFNANSSWYRNAAYQHQRDN